MPNTYNISYSEVIELFTSASNENLSISTFDTGTIDFLDANAVNKTYPYIYLRPISSPGVVDKVRTLTFELYSMDVPKLSDESPVDTISDCEERIYQLIAWFNRGATSRQQTYDVTMTDLSPVNEAFQDRVFGWVATIEVASPWNWDYCDYPRRITPTATAVPTATPQPTATPTPSPTPGPTFIQFNVDDNDSSDCCTAGGNHPLTVYVPYTASSWPANIVGQTLYFDSALTDTSDTNNWSAAVSSSRCAISGSQEITFFYTVGNFNPPGTANNITVNSASICS